MIQNICLIWSIYQFIYTIITIRFRWGRLQVNETSLTLSRSVSYHITSYKSQLEIHIKFGHPRGPVFWGVHMQKPVNNHTFHMNNKWSEYYWQIFLICSPHHFPEDFFGYRIWIDLDNQWEFFCS